ncbi:MAG: hypothetical protein ISR55_02985 [Bacteroidetes bacterium]|nr:hypothetical protein [Bacteroidota bacterium]MBL6962760.1 hypothetical protein [Bacteroidota bacterium]
MKKDVNNILIFWLLVLIPAFVFPDPVKVEGLFNEANELYQKQEYHKAIVLYDSIINLGIESANLFYNTANTNYKLGEYSKAILYYEKARLLGGNQKDILYNLDLANLNISDKIDAIPDFFFVRMWNNTLYYMSSKNWGYTSIMLFILLVLLVIFTMVTRSVFIKKMIIPLIVIMALFFCLATVFTLQKSSIERDSHYAIIFEPTVYVMSAPDDQSTDLFLIHEGLKVRLHEKINDWVKIELADGKIGWIREENYREI